MKTYTQEQLKVIIDNHKKWLLNQDGGSRADLSGANLSGANLYGANLSGADLYGADLYGANLSEANLSRANLYGANLSGASLSGANLYGANLSGANLYGADLYGANLYGADLYGANLSGADLYGANLSGADSEFSLFLGISGMRYNVLLKNDLVRIGCQEHTYEKWKSFKKKDIDPMSENAMDFYKMIIPVLDYHYKGTKWEIKKKGKNGK